MFLNPGKVLFFDAPCGEVCERFAAAMLPPGEEEQKVNLKVLITAFFFSKAW